HRDRQLLHQPDGYRPGRGGRLLVRRAGDLDRKHVGNRGASRFHRRLRRRDPDTGHHVLPAGRRSGDRQLLNPEANDLPVRPLVAWLCPAAYDCGVSTMRWDAPVSAHACSTSASGTARASTSILPAAIASARAGSSARYSCPPTDPWPLPMTVSRAARNAAEGIAAVGPATEPISTQVSGLLRSARAVMTATMAAAAGSPHRESSTTSTSLAISPIRVAAAAS